LFTASTRAVNDVKRRGRHRHHTTTQTRIIMIRKPGRKARARTVSGVLAGVSTAVPDAARTFFAV
jgi:hypothetical protein